MNQQTLVGIYAEKTNEDWSSEFLLNEGISVRGRTLGSGLTFDDFDDLELIDIEAINKSPVTLNVVVTSPGVISVLEEEYEEEERKEKEKEEDEDNEEEDWDDELGINVEVKESQDLLVDGFRFIMGQTLHEELDWMDDLAGTKGGPITEEGHFPLTIPPRCKIVSQLLHGSEEINLVLYPKSIALYSLKLDHDRRQLMAVELNDWLQTMVSKQKSKVETAMRTKDLSWLNRVQNQEKVFNMVLLRAWSEAVSLLWRQKSLHIWDVLFKFSKLVRHFSRHESSTSEPNPQVSNLSWQEKEQLMLHMSDILRVSAHVDASEAVTGQYTKDGVNRPNLHFKFVINQQFSGGVKNKSSTGLTSRTPSLFHEILKSTISLLPEFMEEFALLEIQAACHHCVTMLQFQTEGVSWTPSLFSLFKCYIVLYRVIVSAEKSLTKKQRKRERRKSEAEEMLFRFESLKTNILSDLFYLLHAYSPLDLVFCPHLLPSIEEIKYSEGGNQLSDDDTENEERERSDNSVKFLGLTANERAPIKSVLNLRDPRNLLEEKHSEPHQIDPRVATILSSFESPSLGIAVSSPVHETQRLTRSNLSFLQSHQNEMDYLAASAAAASPDQNKKTAKLIAEVLGDKKVDFFDLFHLLTADPSGFRLVLTAKYRNLSRKHLLKAKVSFALSLLNSMLPTSSTPTPDSAFASAPSTHEVIESLFLETLVLLDNLSTTKFNDVSPPIISPLGILVMEKFAERLVKDLKHKFAISCLESALCAHQLARTGEDKRIYRYLTTVAHEAGDFQKRLLYQSRVLRITKEEGKPNEFVYIANLISQLFTEAGEFLLAERCLRVISLIHLGCPLASVEFEFVDQRQLDYNILPSGVEIPSINWRSLTPSASPPHPGVGNLWTKRFGSGVCDSQQVTSILNLVELLIFSNRHHDAIDLCLSLLKRKIYPQGRATVLLTLAKCYLKLRLLIHCESTLDRIALEADEIVSTTLFKPGYQQTSAPDPSGSHQSKSSTLSSPAAATSKFPVARYHRSLKDVGREGVGIKRSPDGKATRSNRPSRHISTKAASTTPATTPSSTQHRSFAASASTVGFVSRACSYTYMLLRAKCRLAADDPEWSLHWLLIALALCPKGKWDRRSQIRYLMGRCYAKLCMRCRQDPDWGAGDIATTRRLVELESTHASRAEEEFRHALHLCKTHTEDIIKQTKAINRIIELHNSRLFHDTVISKVPISEALDGKADHVLRSIDGLCRISLQLSGDTCSPLELLRTLINSSELSWLQGNSQQAFSAWCEAKTLITITFLQPLTAMSWGPTRSKASDASSRVSFIAGTTDISQFLPDPKNPLGDIPLPAVAYPPGLLSRIFDSLTRIVRLAFYITPCPLSNNGGALLASWIRLNHAIETTVEPLYSSGQEPSLRPLSSFTRLFANVDSEVNRMFFPETYISAAYSTILGIYGLESSPEKLRAAQQFYEEQSRWVQTFRPVDLPSEKIETNLSRPTIPRGRRRSKSVKMSTPTAPLLILTHELEEIAIKEIVQTLCAPSAEAGGTTSSKRSANERRDQNLSFSLEEDLNLSKVDGSKLGLVTATAHLLSPFEMARRALGLEFDLGSPFGEGTVLSLSLSLSRSVSLLSSLFSLLISRSHQNDRDCGEVNPQPRESCTLCSWRGHC
jgi:hypothetical protein